MAIHADGVTMRWLDAGAAGATVGLSGIRREFHPGEGVDWHLLVGDATALPAICSIVESFTSPVPVTVYICLPDPADCVLLRHRDGVTVHSVSSLAEVVHTDRPRGRGQAWIAAEAGLVRELRKLALDELGVARDDLQAAAYWNSGLDGTEGDARLLKRYREELASGADIADSDVRERVELDLSADYNRAPIGGNTSQETPAA